MLFLFPFLFHFSLYYCFRSDISTTKCGKSFILATLDSLIDPLKLCSFSPTIRLRHDNIDDLLAHSKCSTSSCVYTCRPLITGKIPHHRQNARIDSKHSRYDLRRKHIFIDGNAINQLVKSVPEIWMWCGGGQQSESTTILAIQICWLSSLASFDIS